MPETMRRVVGWVVPLAALVVIVGGLAFDQPDTRTAGERATELASSLRCPFCSGESIQESTSQVARDLQAVIREQVDEGMTDEQIIAFFEARYGSSVRLDPPATGWGLALWLLPVIGALGGAVAIVSLRRRRTVETQPTVAVVAPDTAAESS